MLSLILRVHIDFYAYKLLVERVSVAMLHKYLFGLIDIRIFIESLERLFFDAISYSKEHIPYGKSNFRCNK